VNKNHSITDGDLSPVSPSKWGNCWLPRTCTFVRHVCAIGATGAPEALECRCSIGANIKTVGWTDKQICLSDIFRIRASFLVIRENSLFFAETQQRHDRRRIESEEPIWCLSHHWSINIYNNQIMEVFSEELILSVDFFDFLLLFLILLA